VLREPRLTACRHFNLVTFSSIHVHCLIDPWMLPAFLRSLCPADSMLNRTSRGVRQSYGNWWRISFQLAHFMFELYFTSRSTSWLWLSTFELQYFSMHVTWDELSLYRQQTYEGFVSAERRRLYFYFCRFVCLSVCLSAILYSKSYEWILGKFWRGEA